MPARSLDSAQLHCWSLVSRPAHTPDTERVANQISASHPGRPAPISLISNAAPMRPTSRSRLEADHSRRFNVVRIGWTGDMSMFVRLETSSMSRAAPHWNVTCRIKPWTAKAYCLVGQDTHPELQHLILPKASSKTSHHVHAFIQSSRYLKQCLAFLYCRTLDSFSPADRSNQTAK
jgi:hypothetical protein